MDESLTRKWNGSGNLDGFQSVMSASPQQIRSFVGKTPTAVDSQRRLAIPKQWRLDTDTEDTLFFLTLGSGPSLEFHPYEEFEKRMAMAAQKMNDEESDLMATASAADSAIIKLDKQGRFIVPQHLLEEAEIQTNVYCLGSYTCGRIIAAEIWEAVTPPKKNVLTYNHSLKPRASVTETKVMVTETQ